MKTHLSELIQHAITELQTQEKMARDLIPEIQIERTRDKQHGDFASNVALTLAKPLKQSPRAIAEMIIAHLPTSNHVANVEIAGAGFINFFLTDHAIHATIANVLEQGECYGHGSLGQGEKVLLEFVSANPTGPLHVGHGRGAAYGASLANLLRAAGYQVDNEYYVNDAGRQMHILAVSIWLRYLQLFSANLNFPVNGYKGEYIHDIAQRLKDTYQDSFVRTTEAIFTDIPPDETDGGDKEQHIDALIHRMHALLGEDHYQTIHAFGLTIILDDIKEDLHAFSVDFQRWYSEKSLMTSGKVDDCIAMLQKANLLFEKDGALWFNAIHFGDEKDRVVRRGNGQTTYFASDIAYHLDKYQRGYDHIVDILGADHHGYVARVQAGIKAMHLDLNKFKTVLVQFAILYEGKDRVQMSTRSGSFVTLRALREDVSNDAARFFYVMRKAEQHMDFDLQLAKSQSADNPVYYIQYAHARICRVMEQATEKELPWDKAHGLANIACLTQTQEVDLMTSLARYPELLESAAKTFEPHQVAHYLKELAQCFHTYYNAHPFLIEDAAMRNARLCLIEATRIVIANGLQLLGVSAPTTM